MIRPLPPGWGWWALVALLAVAGCLAVTLAFWRW